jgi:hypothetical protein
MCDCRVCQAEYLHPEEIDIVIKDVFEYIIKKQRRSRDNKRRFRCNYKTNQQPS